MVLMGSLFSVFGGGAMWLRWTHPTGWSGNGGPWVVYVVGTLFAIIGVTLLWTSADRRWVIDRSARTVRVVVRRLVHQQSTVVPFDAIDDVALEQSAGMATNSGGTASPVWRVAFLMKDGSRRPWTPYFTNARESQELCAAAARSFGGWAGNSEHGALLATPPSALISHPVATNWGCVAAFLSIFPAVGIGLVGVQTYRVVTWHAVPATVISSDVGVVHGSKGNTYKPVVVYSYKYEGFQFRAATVTPIDISAGQAWAQSIVSRYRRGTTTTAYVNPDDPNRAFLYRRVSLMPLLFVVIPVLIGLLFAWNVRRQRRQVQLAEKHLVPVVNAA